MTEFKEHLNSLHEITHPKPEPKVSLKTVFKLDKKSKKTKNKKKK